MTLTAQLKKLVTRWRDLRWKRRRKRTLKELLEANSRER